MLLLKNRLHTILAIILLSSFVGCNDTEKEKTVVKSRPRKILKSKSPPKNIDAQGPYAVNWYGYPPEMPDKRHLVTLLRSEDYAALDSLLKEFQGKFENDYRYETFVIDAYSAFAIPDPELQHLFDNWIERFPESYAGYGARARYYLGMGWKARGSDYIAKTTADQIAGMEKYFEMAEQDAARALDLNAKLLSVYDALMEINQNHGDLLEIKRLMEMVLRFCPYTFAIRHSYMEALTPRWSGSYREMEEFAVECKKLADINPRLKLFGGYKAWDMGRTIQETDPSSAIKFYSEALTYGDHPTFFTSRGIAYAKQKYFKDALRDLDRAILLRPQRFETLRWRGYVNHNLNMIVQSKLDFELAYHLDPTDSYVREWAKYYQIPAP